MNAQVTESYIEAQIEQLERIPVFGPYLGFMAAAQWSFADALGLLRLGTALRTRQAPFTTPVDAPTNTAVDNPVQTATPPALGTGLVGSDSSEADALRAAA